MNGEASMSYSKYHTCNLVLTGFNVDKYLNEVILHRIAQVLITPKGNIIIFLNSAQQL